MKKLLCVMAILLALTGSARATNVTPATLTISATKATLLEGSYEDYDITLKTSKSSTASKISIIAGYSKGDSDAASIRFVSGTSLDVGSDGYTTNTLQQDTTYRGKVRVTALKAGTITFAITAQSGEVSKVVYIAVTVKDTTPVFKTASNLGTATVGTAISSQNNSTTLSYIAIELENYTITSTDQVQVTISDSNISDFGLTLQNVTNNANIRLSGTPKKAGEVKFTVRASYGIKSASRTFTLLVNGITPTISSNDVKDISSTINPGHSDVLAGTTIPSITFTATGTNQDLVISASIKAGSSTATDLKFTPGTATATNDDKNGGTISGTLTGTLGDSITKNTTYTVTITASNIQGASSHAFTFIVAPKPKITASTASFTWGKSGSYKPTSLNIETWAVASQDLDLPSDKTDYLKALPNGFTLATSGTDGGTISGTWSDHDNETIALGRNKSVSKKIRLLGYKYDVRTSADITLTFEGAAPTITGPTDNNLTYNNNVEDNIRYTATGPGHISWDVGTLPAGLSYSVTGNENTSTTSTLKITGTPTEAFAAKKITITAKNGAGSGTTTPTFTVNANEVQFDNTLLQNLPQGSVKKGDTFIAVNLRAYPGPLKWEAKNLPSGITLSWDSKGGDTTKAQLIGSSYTAITKPDSDGKNIYSITATSTALSNMKVSVTRDLQVYDVPVISTKTLTDVSIGKEYKVSLKASNYPTTWIVRFANSSADFASNPESAGDTFYNAGAENGHYLTFSSETMNITGTLDRIPSGATFAVYVKATNPAGSTEKIYTVKVKGTAPKLSTTKISDIDGTSTVDTTNTIEFTGTMPIDVQAYIDPKTAKTLFGMDGIKSIDLTADDSGNVKDRNNTTGFYFVPATDENNEGNGKGKLVFASGTGISYKGLSITLSATSEATTKPIAKAVKVNVNGYEPVLYMLDDGDLVQLTQDVTITAKAGEKLSGYTFMAGGDNPLTLTSSQKTGAANAKNGIYIDTASTGSYSSEARYAMTINGTPTVGKETKTMLTITAQNTSTKKKVARKVTIIGQLSPTITTAEKGLTKEVELGKSLSLKLAAKGSKPITWSLMDANNNDASDILSDYGLTFDASKGTISGKATAPTTNNNETEYLPLTLYAMASNNAGDSSKAKITIGIKGAKPKFTVSSLTFERDDPDFTSNTLRTNLTDSGTAYIQYSVADTKSSSALSSLGLVLEGSDSNEGTFSATSRGLIASKGTSVKFNADNYGSTVTGSVKIIIYDPDPEIELDDDSIELEAKESIKAEKSLKISLTDESKPTGDTKINWSISTKPARGVTASLKDNLNGTATLTVSVPKKFKTSDGLDLDTSLTVRATNTATKKYAEEDIDISVTIWDDDNSARPADNSSRPELEPEAAPEDSGTYTAKTEGMLTLGTARDTGNISASERAFLHENGYIAVAVLPELSADVSGQYDIEATLDDGAEVGAKLFWLAFPKDGIDRPDDEIADFLSMDGEYIENVPEERNIIVSPWLTEGVIYAPVIAVKE